MAGWLGRVDISVQPDEGRHRMPKPQTAPAQLLKPREHPPITLHLPNKALHQVTLPVSIRVIHRHLPVGTPRYHRRYPQLCNALPQPSGIVSLVRNHIRSGITGQQCRGLGNVVILASRQDKTQRVLPSPSTVIGTLAPPATCDLTPEGLGRSLFRGAGGVRQGQWS